LFSGRMAAAIATSESDPHVHCWALFRTRGRCWQQSSLRFPRFWSATRPRLSPLAKRNRFALWVVSSFIPELLKRGQERVLVGSGHPFGMLHAPSSFASRVGLWDEQAAPEYCHRVAGTTGGLRSVFSEDPVGIGASNLSQQDLGQSLGLQSCYIVPAIEGKGRPIGVAA
jgi:hypothetical protein